MNESPSTVKSGQEKLPQELIDLLAAVNQLPKEHRQQIDSVVQRVVEGTRRRKRILGLVQEALSQLRLDMKYLMFDLEATRRERNSLRRELDNDNE